MRHLFLLVFLTVIPSLVSAAIWQEVADLTAGEGQLVDLAVSPTGNTVVVSYSPGILLYAKPPTGWADATTPTTVLTCSDSEVFAIALENYGVATNDSTVVAEGYRYVNTHVAGAGNQQLTQVLIVWQEPTGG